jgi:hypothetical protein
MSDSNGTPRDGKKLAVYAINEKDNERGTWWQKIGMAFTNRDGSIAIYLDALPIGTNKLQVREQRDEARPAAGSNGASGGSRRAAASTEEVQP